MSYPFSGFGTFLFDREEQPVFGSDLGWNRPSPSVERSRPLGSSTDSIVTLAIGSAERSFEMYLSPQRVRDLEARVTTTGLLTDWERPDPDSRQAFLVSVVRQQLLNISCWDGVTRARWRVSVRFVSQ